jgi:hypothetical protein
MERRIFFAARFGKRSAVGKRHRRCDQVLVAEPAQPAHAVESSVAADDWLAMSCTVGVWRGAVFALKPNPPFQEEVRGIE